MNDLEFYAARLEYHQAERDYREARRAFEDAGWPCGSPLDYAVWSTVGYAGAAERASVRIVTGN